MALLDLTIAIPVLNEEKNLRGCLEAIGKDFVSKIILIDSGSTDATFQIAEDFGVEVVHFVWNGQFPKKRNWLLRNYSFETKWILFLDADEYLTSAFKRELVTAVGDESKEGFWLRYTRYFLGKKLKGGYPLKKLALFKIGSGEYERIEEMGWSKLDMEVHEHPIIAGNIGEIKSEIEHYDFRGISHYVAKHNDYSSWEAERYIQMMKEHKEQGLFTWKQRVKYKLMDSPMLGIFYFLGSYILMGGFRDGKVGLTFSLLKMSYFIQIYTKIQEKSNN